MANARTNQERPALDMTAMIDCVFQLLIFFIVTLKQDDILANLEVPQTTIRTVSIPNQGVQEVPETTYTPSTLFLLESVKVLAVGTTYLDPESPIGMSETVGIGGGASSITIAATCPRLGGSSGSSPRNTAARSR